ncbi:hypothetical protein [Fibrobacter succinogenes]|uniref:NYN domain-containing protein n=1 Tax=Fibrobacter succinogenes TaxID=833 RepID=A0A380S6K2_FIBSU|nr:hypothetical protein [Fibrobacter succinogenes]PWJ35879.1 hypothetical protein IE02_1940 [Fibrobacter succinogenes subsp. elongatus]SUQ24534.1 hypothetical protein SAMN05661053_1940 [Fibrobacter succinogenes]
MNTCLILVDFANCDWEHISVSNLIRDIYLQCKSKSIDFDLAVMRLYGGWYVDDLVSDQRQEAVKKIGSWPTIIRISESKIIRIQFLFADEILGYKGNENANVRRTFVERKAKLKGIKIKGDVSNLCNSANCRIKETSKWLSTQKPCLNNICGKKFGEVFVRYEQKQVDTHLLCDFILSLLNQRDCMVFIMSKDLDFMPGIQTACLMGCTKRIGLILTNKVSEYQMSYFERNDIIQVSCIKEDQ